ncbi:hypothetical protein SAMN05444349_1792 [Bacteroides faecichinchillae]|uniref:Immunity MXAN-0049 protein domain-containing protein n=1 Tax=Bacteroides faecichinchillae TaxID=871325 RepID=A0A1M5GQY9_9BACE|nr:DUF1629 domain-containing protein [Bacteroides faecichinchillae]THG53368.1 hypothetical protein E5981_19065 [Bacteroides faecichinchillae]SHG06146.1 hypothetical protein SAMN05444349_1792 [Bacteroides faecichinchillae]
MRYFIMSESLDKKIIGCNFPQVHRFTQGYDPEASNGLFSLYKYREDFPDYIPNLDGFMISSCTKLTDFISSSFSHRLRIMNERAKTILEQHHLGSYRFYPLVLYKGKVKYDYYLFNFISTYSDFVNYEKTSFQEYNIANGEKSEVFFVKSRADFLHKKSVIEHEKGISWGIWGSEIVMSKGFDQKLDFFVISLLDANIYVSERLKNSIESNGLTGWEFIPAMNLKIEE